MTTRSTARLRDTIHRRFMRALGDRPQTWLCKQAGIADSTLSQQITNRRYTLEVLWRAAPVLGVTVGWLCGEDDETLARALTEIERLCRMYRGKK